MTELEKIAYAKSFLDKMAEGINPLDDSPIAEGNLLKNIRISRCMAFVSDLLGQVIEGGGIRKKAPAEPFLASAAEVAPVGADTEALPLTRLCDRISAPFTGNGRKKLCYRELAGALTQMGILEEEPRGDGKLRRRPTALGRSVGVFTEERTGAKGPYTTVLYSPAAQSFILDNFDSIMEQIGTIRQVRKAAKEK